MDRQIFELDDATIDLTSLLPIQVSGGATEAGKIQLGYLKEVIAPKVYAAYLSQTGTSAPTATVIQNDLGGTVVWTRNSAGNYTGTLTAAFLTGKTLIYPRNQTITVADRESNSSWTSEDTVTVLVRKISDSTFVDSGLSESIVVKIEVYPSA